MCKVCAHTCTRKALRLNSRKPCARTAKPAALELCAQSLVVPTAFAENRPPELRTRKRCEPNAGSTATCEDEGRAEHDGGEEAPRQHAALREMHQHTQVWSAVSCPTLNLKPV
eukprot:6203828-Pleurochrysis_carterae.AAC.7